MGHDNPEELYNKPVRPFGTGFFEFLFNAIDGPVTWLRESVIEPNRKDYNWYHRRFPRVPTIDQCHIDDSPCIFEADKQFERDRKVDIHILVILRRRWQNCCNYEKYNIERCDHLYQELDNAATNFFIKYGELGYVQRAYGAYMKQKHRMVWERRYGPVGSGMTRIDQQEKPAEEKVC